MNTGNPYAPPRAAVERAAVPDVEDSAAATLADRGTRLGAAILDGIIILAMIYIPLLIGLGLRPMVGQALGGFLALAGFVAWLWLTILFLLRNGQSIAKKLLGIKVVSTDGSPASMGQIIMLRNVINAVLGVVPLYSFVDALFIFGEKRQCIHDKIAGTIVVKA
jgi:uncharacterized RDD family membrane protein YckC